MRKNVVSEYLTSVLASLRCVLRFFFDVSSFTDASVLLCPRSDAPVSRAIGRGTVRGSLRP